MANRDKYVDSGDHLWHCKLPADDYFPACQLAGKCEGHELCLWAEEDGACQNPRSGASRLCDEHSAVVSRRAYVEQGFASR